MKLHRKSFFQLFLLLTVLISTTNLFAQSDHTGQKYPTRTFAITKATIIPAPGQVVDSGTVVISNGLITAVGTNVSIPSDAEVIDGTGLYVYAGFIDGISNTGAERPEQMEAPSDLFTPDPPNDYAGITPEHSALQQLNVEDNSIESMRKLGFTISHVVPHGRMLPGSGSLILLKDADTIDEIVLKQDVSLFTQFSGAPGAYPGNTLGIMAKWRNLYKNAELSKGHEDLYARNPAGIQRPVQNRVLQAFYPVIERKKAVFYNTNSMLEARRAMKMKNELGFDLVLSDLEDAWFLLDDLNGSDVKVMMSLNLPDEPKEMDEEETTDEVTALADRRMEFYTRHLSQYIMMEDQGVKYGFSTLGTTSSKIKSNLTTLVEFGLNEGIALAALTTNAAEILGIDQIAGTIETGKLGNIVVSTSPYFQKDSKVKYVFVDGHKYEMDTSKKAVSETSAEAAAAILGDWSYRVESPQGEYTGTMTITMDGGTLSGVLSSNTGAPATDMESISFADGVLSFFYDFSAGGQTLEIEVVGDVVDNEFIGEANIAAYNLSIPMFATKDPNN